VTVGAPLERSRRAAVFALLLAAFFWSLGGVLIKLVEWHPLAVAGSRSAVCAVFLALLFAFRARRSGARLTLRAPSRAEWLGAIAYAATVVLFVLATKWTSAANAILLQYTAPIWVALAGGPLLGERANAIDFATIAVVLGGMLLFFFEGLEGGRIAGDVVAVLSGIAFAGLAITMRRQKDASPLASILFGSVLAACVGLPAAFVSDAALPDAQGVLALLTLGVVQLGIPYVLYAFAVKHVSALEIILIPILEPLLNPVWAMLALGEVPGALSLGGGALVLGAVTLRGVWRARSVPS
jgi:drug/metabolite transporter (DMT)-like permease